MVVKKRRGGWCYADCSGKKIITMYVVPLTSSHHALIQQPDRVTPTHNDKWPPACGALHNSLLPLPSPPLCNNTRRNNSVPPPPSPPATSSLYPSLSNCPSHLGLFAPHRWDWTGATFNISWLAIANNNLNLATTGY